MEEPRAPYGSKLNRIVQAASELYEFTPAQLVERAGKGSSLNDFENAKRPGKPLELQRVLVEIGTSASARGGRPAKVYSFKDHDAYLKALHWLEKFTSSGLEPDLAQAVQIAPELQTAFFSSGSKSNEIFFRIVSGEIDTVERKLLWAKRGIRHLGNEFLDIKSSDSSLLIFNKGNYLAWFVRFKVVISQLNYQLEKIESQDLINELWQQLTTILEFSSGVPRNLEIRVLEISGLVETGISLVDQLVVSNTTYIQFIKATSSFSDIWAQGQWEEVERRFKRLTALNKGSEIASKLTTYWNGLLFDKELPLSSEKGVTFESLLKMMEKEGLRPHLSSLISKIDEIDDDHPSFLEQVLKK